MTAKRMQSMGAESAGGATAAAANATQRLRIHAVGLSRDQNTELLYNLARSSGGQFVADR